ncbi:hypothetical protein SH449x_001664 [Pirellulaceae bacterium SH449]
MPDFGRIAGQKSYSVYFRLVTLVIVQRAVAFDFTFEDQLTDLDLEVANEHLFGLIPFSTLLVPKVGDAVLKSFLPSGQIIQHRLIAEQE